MTRGRCAGCGAEDASCKKVKAHVQSCPEFLRLWKSEPDKALDPEQEYVRWKEWTSSPEFLEKKEAATSAKYAKYRADAELKIAVSKTRFGSKLTENEVKALADMNREPVRQVDGRDPQEILDDPDATKMMKLRAEIALRRG